MHTRTIVAAILLSFAGALRAQVTLTSLNTPIDQNFDALVGSGNIPWIDNMTLPGWYHARTGTGNLLTAGDGSSSSGGFYSFGSAGSAERALGSIGSGSASVGDICWGIRLLNNTGAIITALQINCVGEQWRNSGAAAQTLSFAYRTGIGLTGLLTGSWSAAPALDFTSPITGGTAGALNGNLPPNRIQIGTLLSGISIPNGEEILLRWYDPDHPGGDHGLAIDDLTIIPYGVAGPTTVQFSLDSSSHPENGGAATIAVSIANPSPTLATSVEVAWIGGTAANGADVLPAYATQTLFFPAGSGAAQSVSVPLYDDALFEGDETAIFQLQNVAGGYLPLIGPASQHILTIVDDDLPPDPAVVVNEVYNGGGALNTDEAVELIVNTDHLDLRGWSLADATGGGGYPHGIVAFTNDPLWSDLEAGTIILIGGTASVPAVDADPSDGLLLLRVPPAGGINRYFSANGSSITISGSSDAVALRDNLGAHIHGLAHGSANRNTLPPNRHGWRSGAIATGQSVFFARAGGPMSAQDFNADAWTAAGAPSMGNPNDADGNRSFLRAARSRLIASAKTLSGTFYWEITQKGGAVTQTGPVNACNSLAISDGSWNDGGFGLAADGSGNTQNGAGAGNLSLGNNDAAPAILQILGTLGPVTGALSLANSDATVDYSGTAAQTILPAAYNNAAFRFGDSANRKRLGGAMRVDGVLTIDNGAWVDVTPPNLIDLGPTGSFQNNGRFLGSIQATRAAGTIGSREEFGDIGFSLTPNAAPLPGLTTVRMTSGRYLWVNDLPSILKYYTVRAGNGSGIDATLTYRYEHEDLNGQTEGNLALKYSGDGGSTWNSPGGALNTSANSLTLPVSTLNGIWTAHANPPRGVIEASMDSIFFETEEFGPIPPSRLLTVSNAKGEGSIVEWNATSSTTQSPAWLSLTPAPAAGVNSGSFLVNIARSDLAPNIYTGLVTIADPHAVNNPKQVPVVFRVQKRREICVGADTIFIKASCKLPDASKPVAVLNCGGNFGPGVIAWNAAAGPAPILSLAPAAGMEGQSFLLTPFTQWRNAGNYPGSVTIAGINSALGTPIWNSPLTIPVMVEIEPSTNFIAGAANLAAGSSYTICNAYGQRVAIVKVNEGAISSLTVKMFPYQLPSGLARLRYVRRYYQFEAPASHYNVDVTLFYTCQELLPMNIRNGAALRGWRQYPPGGAWRSTAGGSDPLRNSVTIAGITDFAGNWAMAAPWTPKENADPVSPAPLSLEQNAPNPVYPAADAGTWIAFSLPEKCRATLQIRDLLGNIVATPLDGEFEAGRHTARFDAAGMKSGIYVYRLTTPFGCFVKKMAVVR